MNKTKNNWNKIVAIACILHCSTSYSMEYIRGPLVNRLEDHALDHVLDRAEIEKERAECKQKTDEIDKRLEELEEQMQVNKNEREGLTKRIAGLEEQQKQCLGTDTQKRLTGKLLGQLRQELQDAKENQKKLAASKARLCERNAQHWRKCSKNIHNIAQPTKAAAAECTEELNASACKTLEVAFDFIRMKCDIMQQNIEEYDAALENADPTQHAEIIKEQQKLVNERKGIIVRKQEEEQKIKDNPNIELDVHGIINRILGNGEHVQDFLSLFAELSASSVQREADGMNLFYDMTKKKEKALRSITNSKA